MREVEPIRRPIEKRASEFRWRDEIHLNRLCIFESGTSSRYDRVADLAGFIREAPRCDCAEGISGTEYFWDIRGAEYFGD